MKISVVAIFLSITLIFSSISAVPANARNYCPNMNPKNAQSVFECLSGFQQGPNVGAFRMIADDTCRQGIDYIRKNIIDKSRERWTELSCTTLAEAWKLHSGKDYFWSACIPTKENIGTPAHMKSCLERYGAFYRSKSIDNLKTCDAAFDVYEEAMSAAIYPSLYFSSNINIDKVRRLLFGEYAGVSMSVGIKQMGKVRASMSGDPRLQGYEIDQASAPMRVVTNRDCSVYISALASPAQKKEWENCSNFEQSNISAHISKCLGGEISRLKECPAIRTAYEDKLRGAYGGVLPAGYKTPTCIQIASAIPAPAPKAGPSPDAAPRTTPPAKVTPPASSGPSTLLVVLGAGVLAIILVGAALTFRKATPSAPAPKAGKFAPLSDETAIEEIKKIDRFFDAGTGAVESHWKHTVKDRIEIQGYQGAVSYKKVNFEIEVDLRRSLGSLPKSSRELLRVESYMREFGLPGVIPMLDDAKAGIIWDGGKAEVVGYKYGKVFEKYISQKDMGTGAGVADLAMKNAGLNKDVATSYLIEVVDALKGSGWAAHPLVAAAARRLKGGAAWAASDDLKGDFDPAPGERRPSLFLGLHEDGKTEVRYSGEGSLVSIAAPGSGKTQCHVLPNLLEWEGPAIILDVKGELYEKTAPWRAQNPNLGAVYKFSPLDPDESHHFNPLDYVRDDPDHIWDEARQLASLIVVAQSKKDPFFEQRAQEIITGAIAVVCMYKKGEERSFSGVIDFINKRDWYGFIASLQMSEAVPEMVRLGHSLESASANEKTLDSVLQTAQNGLASFSGRKVERVMKRSDWSPLDFREAPYPTLYICLKPGEIDTYSSLLRVFIAQHIRTLIQQLPERDVTPVLFMLDELPRLRHMPPVEEALEVGRQYGIKLWMIAQSLGQFEKSYPNANGMLGSCAVRIFMNPSMHDGTAERVSRELGFFDSPLDGSRQQVAEPQALAGPEFADMQIIMRSGARPIKATKQMAWETEPYASRMRGEQS